MSAEKKGNEDEVLDLNSLRTFTIPKLKKSKKELFESISLTSREYLHEVLPALEKNYKERDVVKSFNYSFAQLVHNHDLLSSYLEKRKELRQDGYSEKEMQDSFAFLCVEDNKEVKQICEDGIRVGNSSVSVLGNPEMGVCLCKHPDLSKPTPFYNGATGAIIIFKVIKGKVKLMVENRGGGIALEPTPNYDCHISKNANTVDLASSSPQYAYESTQLYFYEYGDLGVEERPRQILPFAVVQFSYKGGQKAARPPLLKQVSPKVQGSTSKVASRMPTLSPSLSNPRSSHHKAQMATPKHPAQPPGLDPKQDHRYPQAPKKLQDPRTPQEPMAPKDPRLLQDPRLTKDPRLPPDIRPSQDPRIKYRLGSRSSSTEDSQSDGRGSCERDAEVLLNPADKLPCVGQVGESVGDTGIVVWGGHLMSQGTELCTAEIVAFGSAVKPARIGPRLCIGKRLPFRTLRSRFFSNTFHLPRNKEVNQSGKYYSYGELRPTKDGHAKFNQILAYLSRKSSGVSSLLEGQVEVILLTSCEITQALGLTKSQKQSVHCIFVSPVSRQNMLLGKDCPSPACTVPSPHPPSSPAENRLVPSPSLIRFTPPLSSPTPSQGGSTHGASMLNKESISDAFQGQTKPAFQQYDLGPPSVGSQQSTDSWSLPPSPGVFSPSPGIIHNVDELHPTTTPLFKEPPNPTRLMHGENVPAGSGINYDEGYQKYVPVESLVYKKILVKTFQDQSSLQDKRNIDMARRKIGIGMGPPSHRPSSRTGEGSPSSVGSLPRRRTPSQDSGSVGSTITSSRSDSHPSPASSQGDNVRSPHVQTPPRTVPTHVIGPHGQHIEPISPAGSGSGSMEPPSPISPYTVHPPTVFDPADQHAQVLQQQLHQKMSPIKGSPISQVSPGFTAQSPSMPVANSPYTQQPPKEVPIPAYHGPGTPTHLPPGHFNNTVMPPGNMPVMDYNHQSICGGRPGNQLQGNIPGGLGVKSPLHQTPGHHQPFQPGIAQPQRVQEQLAFGQNIHVNASGKQTIGPHTEPMTSSGHRVDPRLLRRQGSMPSTMVSTSINTAGIPLPTTSTSILENILMTSSMRAGSGLQVTSTPPHVALASGSADKYSVSGSHVIPSPQLGIPSRDPRLSATTAVANVPATSFSLDGSQNLTKSLSVGTTTPPVMASSIGKATLVSPAPSQTSTANTSSNSNINLMLSSLIETLTGTIGSPSSGTPPISTSTSTCSNSNNSTTTMTLATGDTTLCQTEGLSTDLSQPKAGTVPGQSMATTKSKLGSGDVPYDPFDDGDLPYEPEDEAPYDPSDDIIKANIEEARFSSEDELEEEEEIIKRPSLASVADLKEDFDNIMSQPESTKSKLKTTEEDLKLSEDLINLIVVGQPLAAKAARELKEQIRDIEEQSKMVEEKMKGSESSHVTKQEKTETQDQEETAIINNLKSSETPTTASTVCSKASGLTTGPTNVSKRRRSRESSLEKPRPPKRRSSHDQEKKSSHKRSTKEETGSSCVTKASLKQPDSSGDKATKHNPLEFLQPAGTVPVKALGRIPKRTAGPSALHTKLSEVPSENAALVQSPSEETVTMPKHSSSIKEIPVDVQSEDLDSSANGLSSRSRRSKCLKELAYYNQIYDGASNDELLALGLDYISLRFLGGAKVQKDVGSNEIKVTIDTKLRSSGPSMENLDTVTHEIATRDSVKQVIHCSTKETETITETQEQKDRVLLWHIALHYLLPLIEEPDKDSREVVEEDKAKSDAQTSQRQGSSSKSQETTGKFAGRDRGDVRHHPYRRQTRSREEEREKEEIFKCYRSYRDLNDLMQCLTSQNFRSRQTRPLTNIFQGPFSRKDPPRFKNYTFRRHSMNDVEKARGGRLSHDDVTDKSYTVEEVKDFQKRKKITVALDSELNKSLTQRDQKLEHFELEKQVYGEDENKNQTEKSKEATNGHKGTRSVSNHS